MARKKSPETELDTTTPAREPKPIKPKATKAKEKKSVLPPLTSAAKKTLLEQVEEERQSIAAAAKSRRKIAKPEDNAPLEKVEQAPSSVKVTPSPRKKKVAVEAVSEPAPTEKEVKAKPAKAATPKVSRAKKPQVVSTAIGDTTVEHLPVPTWRKTDTSRQKPFQAEHTESQEVAEPRLATRRSRTRKRKDRKDLEITAQVFEPGTPVEAAAPEPAKAVKSEPEPEINRRPAIPIPPDAVRVILHEGVPKLVNGKTVIPPLVFFSSASDESRLATVLEEIKQAADHGVHLFSMLVELEVDLEAVDDAVAFASYIVKKIATVDPEARIILRTAFVASVDFEKKFPDARYLAEGGDVAEPSLCDDKFWGVAEECLTLYIRKLRKMDPDSRIVGVHLERGEWFLAGGSGYDISEAAKMKFRDWLRHRYRGDNISLRASWFDGNVDATNVQIPDYREVSRIGKEFVRTDRRARRWVDYHLFLSDSTCERIASLAYAAKLASDGHFLVGASYGYTFEWSHPASGHLSLGKLLRSPDLDYIAGPPSYKNREPGGSSPFPAPIDSIALNGKLYISEEDFKTPISGEREPDDFNPVMKTPQALGSVHWRGAGTALAHSSGVCWMDSWGNGWLNSKGIWERGESIQKALIWRLGTKAKDPDVSVLIDERSLAYLVDQRAFEVLVQNVRESVLRAGLSVGFYLLSDLAHRENFPESKLYAFVNAWDIRPEVRSAIKTRLQKDGKVLFWLYSAGLFEGGRDSLERVREVTGIALRPQPFNSKPGTTILNTRDPLCQYLPENAISKGGQLEPSYFAIPEDGLVLGEYSQTGLPSFIQRSFQSESSGQWHSIFLGEPIVTPGLFRSLAQKAGAHVWSFQNDVVHVNEPFLTIHCTGTAPRTLALPDKYVAYSISDAEWVQTEGNSLKFQGLEGTTHCFLVGTRAEIEAILALDPAEVLELSELPQQTENTLHWDDMRFDVPIMKLDEWVEESWSDEMADDLLIKPSMIDSVDDVKVEAEESQRSRGKRRRKTRSNNERGKRDNGAEDSMFVNVMFRKRE